MAKHKIMFYLIVFLSLISLVNGAILLSATQDIKPGDDWKQSVTLANERRNAYLEGDFTSDNGWCKWDNGKTVKHIKLDPREVRSEVLIIKVPSDVVLDKTVCLITFEGKHIFKTENYIILIIIVVVFLGALGFFLRWLKKQRGKKPGHGGTNLEEALRQMRIT